MEIELPSETGVCSRSLGHCLTGSVLPVACSRACGDEKQNRECQGLRRSNCVNWLFGADNKITWRVSREIELFYRRY